MKIDQKTTRAMNRQLILNLLRREEKPLSRVEISNVTGLSRATVTGVVSDLIAEKYLVEGDTIPGDGGRRPIPLVINYAGHSAIGINMKPGHLECVLTDLAAEPVASLIVDVKNMTPNHVLTAAAKAVRELVAQAPAGTGDLTGIGVAMSGVIDADEGVCLSSQRFGWENVPLAALLSKRTRVPVWVDDDMFAFALAHHLFGLGRRHDVFAALAIGRGIGFAVVNKGEVQRGAHGSAAKLGHVLHRADGPLCECGRRGCLQAQYSEPALVARWREERGLDESADRFAMRDAARAGDRSALDILREAGEAIGQHLAAAVAIVDPEVIVAGGEAVCFGDLLFEPIRQQLARHCFTEPPPILLVEQEDSYWITGAAVLATRGLFMFEKTPGLD